MTKRPDNNSDLPQTLPEAATTTVAKQCVSRSQQLETNKSKASSWYSWIVLVLVMLCLAWVMVFTIMASHTKFMRDRVYETFDTQHEYLSEKTGSRIFTYLVVFFVVPGMITHMANMYNISFPKPSIIMTSSSISLSFWPRHVFGSGLRLSPLEIIAILFILGTQIATFVARVTARFEVAYWPTERVWYEISKTIGKMIAINLLIILFPVSKSSFWWSLFNYHFERVIKWHRWISWWLVCLVIVHAITAIVSMILEGSNSWQNCWVPNVNCRRPGGFEDYMGEETSKIIFYGWLSFAFGALLVMTSLPYFRRRHFECFYYTHVIIFVPLLITVILHYPDLIYYMAPGLIAYLLDKLVWFYTSRRSTRIRNLSNPAPGFVRLQIAVDPMQYKPFEPGQWVQINIPVISFWE
jgi:hypothetical protein